MDALLSAFCDMVIAFGEDVFVSHRRTLVVIAFAVLVVAALVAASAHAVAAPSGRVVFDRAQLLETTSETSANVSIGDLNHDGHLDIVIAKGRHWPLVDRVLLGDGRGNFPTAYDLGKASDRSYTARLVDLDGDGSLDVIVSNDMPDPKLVYLNDGHGHFRVGSTFGKPEWPTRNAAVADLDGDGKPDIIVANRFGKAPGANYVCLNRGGGRFDANCIAFSHESATTITPADFNGDGKIDLLVPNRDGGQSYIYLNDGKANFPTRMPFGPADATFRMAEVADFNGDGRLDIVAIDERRGEFIYFGEGGGKFSAGVSVGNAKAAPYALLVVDLDGDGKPDLIVGNVEAPSVVYYNDGDGRHFTAVPFGDNKGTVYGLAVGDLNEDGVPDIAAARSEAPNVLYFGRRASTPSRR